MIWGSFAGSRVGDLHRVSGTLKQKGYHSILQHHAIPFGLRLVAHGFIRQQDNDQSIPSGNVRTTLEEKNKTVRFKSWNGQHSLHT